MNKERAHEIVAQLTGSAQTLQAALRDGEDEYDPVLVEAIDDAIFNCTTCGWWCENEEMAESDDGPQCMECAGEEWEE